MILDYILNNCTWTRLGIDCPDANSARLVHKFLREAILNRHLYVCKAIGFEIKSTFKSRPHAGTYIARHTQVADSYPEVMVHLQDKLFLTNKSCVARTSLKSGGNTVDSTQFYVDGKYEISAIATSPYICRVTEQSVFFNLQLSYDCGYKSCSENSRALENSFFPCNTDFYAGDFFRVLPPVFGSSQIRINYYNNVDYNTLRELLSNWAEAVRMRNVRKEELTWVLSFGL